MIMMAETPNAALNNREWVTVSSALLCMGWLSWIDDVEHLSAWRRAMRMEVIYRLPVKGAPDTTVYWKKHGFEICPQHWSKLRHRDSPSH